MPAVCGDGYVNEGVEECDDEGMEECDDGNANDGCDTPSVLRRGLMVRPSVEGHFMAFAMKSFMGSSRPLLRELRN